MSAVAETFAGDVLDASDPGYDEARAVFNAMIDRRPARILRPRSVADVAPAVRLAVASGLEIAVRGGGHSVAGHSSSDGGVVIDLSLLRGVEVDAEAKIAIVEGGATWREVDRATGRARLATPGGVVSTTGVGGFALGGGVGWLARSHGLTCDNLLWAELVLPSGEIVRASEDDDADVLWALRGGGGNFGVVQRFAFALHPVDRVTGGIVSYPGEHAEKVLAHYAAVMDDADDDLAAILDFASADDDSGRGLVTILACSTRTDDAGAAAVGHLLAVDGAGEPTVSVQRSFRYPLWQQVVDHTAPHGRLNYWKSVFLPVVGGEAIAQLSALGRSRPSAQTRVHLIRGGGRASRMPRDATAFAARGNAYVVHLITAWTDPAQTAACKAWSDEAFESLRPLGPAGAYLNFIGDEGEARVRASFGEETYGRLAAVKGRLDPANQFRLNQNIRPAAAVVTA